MFRDILKIISGALDFLREIGGQGEKKKQKKLDVSGSVWDRPETRIPKPPRRPNPFRPEE